MSQENVVAQKYAQAAFEFAKNAHQIKGWVAMLQNSVALFSNEKILRFFIHPDITLEQRTSFLKQFTGEYYNENFFNFLQLLLHNKRILLVDAISRIFTKIKNKYDDVEEVAITCSHELTKEQKEKIENYFAKKLNCSLLASYKIDDSLIGGLIVHYGDKVIDGSLRWQLEKLKDEIMV